MEYYIWGGIILAISTLIWLFLKWKKRVILITHSKGYHLDDVFATAVLVTKIQKEGKFFQLIRTRDEKVFEKWRKERKSGREVYIYDVGRIYCEDKNEFDHHQKGGAAVRKNGIEYSSAGLVWKKFGEEISGSKELAWKIEKKLVLAIDALDNGQSIYEYKYDFFNYDLTNLIKTYIPLGKKTDWRMKIAFCKSVRLVKFILEREIKSMKKILEDEIKVADNYKKSEDKRVLVFEEESISLSSITDKFPSVIFTISKKSPDVWVIETVVKKWGSFERRKYLPKSWAGMEGYDLDNMTGVVGGIFCHRGLFIASAKTEKAAREMVEIALNSED